MGLDCLIEKIEKAMGEGWEWEAWVVDRVVKEGGEISMVGGGERAQRVHAWPRY